MADCGWRMWRFYVRHPQSAIRHPTFPELLLRGPALRFCQPEEEFSAIREENISAHGTSGTILRLKALYRDLGSHWNGFLRQAESIQIIRAGAFDHPRSG